MRKFHHALTDIANSRLTFRHWFRDRSIAFSDLKKLTVACAEIALFDEIGFLFEDAKGAEYWVICVRPGFLELAKAMQLDNLLGEDWFYRAEQGQVLGTQISLPRTILTA